MLSYARISLEIKRPAKGLPVSNNYNAMRCPIRMKESTTVLNRLSVLTAVSVTLGLSLLSTAAAEDEANKIELAGGTVVMAAPAAWKKETPKSRIVEYEFSAPADASAGDEKARITIMSAGGSIEANIDRWYGQFEQPSGKSTKDVSKTEKLQADGMTIHWVDIPGNFKETMGGGPFSGGKTVIRKDHRMLGAIVETKNNGLVFIKMTGHQDVIEKLAEGFKKSLKEMDAK